MKNKGHPGYQLVQLPNGSWSVHSMNHAETFHPVIGPAAEAKRLYVGQLQLAARAAAADREFVVWDVGLGAAANAIGVLRATRDSPGSLRLVSFDHTLEPLRFALQHADRLDYLADYESHARRLLEEQTTRFQDGQRDFRWEVRQADFPSLLASAPVGVAARFHESGFSVGRESSRAEPNANRTARGYARPTNECMGPKRGVNNIAAPQGPASNLPPPDAILFDAYSPAKNPEMWTRPLFHHLFQRLDPHRPCALATYSRSTLVRVTLLVAGFRVGVGHATGEKEETTVAANDPRLVPEPLTRAWLTRARRSTSGEPLHEPVYRQLPLRPETWEQLQDHPQFRD